MKTVFLMIICMASMELISQPKITIDPLIGLDFSYRTLDYVGSSYVKDIRDNAEIGKFGYRIGSNVNLKIRKKVFLKTGIRFVNNGYNEKKNDGLVYESEYDPVTKTYTKDPSLPHSIQKKYNYYFIEIPVGFRYVFSKKKYSYFLELGLTNTFYIHGITKTVTDIRTSKSDLITISSQCFYRFNVFGSVGFQYQFNKRMQGFVQPIVRYALTPNTGGITREHLYSAGIEFGTRYAIAKK